jgi:hypothetical protein
MSGAVRRLTPTGECDPKVQATCASRMATLEKSVCDLQESNRRLEQSNRELIEAVHEATAESKRRSASLDDLARKLLASDSGLNLLKTSSPDLPVVPEEKGKET